MPESRLVRYTLVIASIAIFTQLAAGPTSAGSIARANHLERSGIGDNVTRPIGKDMTDAPTFDVLHAFNGTDGAMPFSVTQGADGGLYGTTLYGGAGSDPNFEFSGGGTAFEISPDGTFKPLHMFNGPDGWYPVTNLVQGRAGDLYGVTVYGGVGFDPNNPTNSAGTIFRITRDGQFYTMHAFTGPDGRFPNAKLIAGIDGSVYGTTSYGGSNFDPNNPWNSYGTIFRIAPDGTFTTLHSFSGTDGADPRALVRGSDGCFYGVTALGGNGFEPGEPWTSFGTVFKITPDGTFTTLHFFSGYDGTSPVASLVEASDGDFYGATVFGGNGWNSPGPGFGTVFRVSASGDFTELHAFTGYDGWLPEMSLVQGADGGVYGTDTLGGSGFDPNNPWGSGGGTVFRVGQDGSAGAIHSFTGTDGWEPRAPLISGTDGNLYGSAIFGGDGADPNNPWATNGTLFRLSPDGTFSTLHSFTGGDGSDPWSGVIETADGSLAGVTAGGGLGDGVIFKLDAGLPPVLNACAQPPVH